MDPARLYDAEIASLLGPGERLACAVTASYFAGEERGEPVPGVSFDPINGLDVAAWNAAAERLVAGVSLSGAPGSLARGLRGAFDALQGGANHLLLTDARLVAADLGSARACVVWQVPRHVLAGVRLKPRLLQRGRVAVGFTDGSVLCLVTGMLTAGEAKRLVAAVS